MNKIPKPEDMSMVFWESSKTTKRSFDFTPACRQAGISKDDYGDFHDFGKGF
jgi:hypothetical protein